MYYSRCPEIVDNTLLSRLVVERGADLEGLGMQTRVLVNALLERTHPETPGSQEDNKLFS